MTTDLPDAADTIAAVSSAAGAGGRMMVRLSGSRAFELAVRLMPDLHPISKTPMPQIRAARFLFPEGARMPCRASLFRGPRSYTGEDVVEIALPGSPPLAEAAFEAALAAGARPAAHGEFTLRAFLNGRIDLARAEAVAEVIAADDPAAARAALRTLQGRLSTALRDVEATLVDACARLEGAIDFADQDIEVLSPSEIAADLRSARERIAELRSACRLSNPADALPRIALVGPPNAGKTSLFNALSGRAGAIASPEAGTTRDLLRAVVSLDGADAEIWDSPGLHRGGSPLSNRMTDRALDHAAGADLVLFVIDITDAPVAASWLEALPRHQPLVGVWNKSDLADGKPPHETPCLDTLLGDQPHVPVPDESDAADGTPLSHAPPSTRFSAIVTVSAKTGAGLGELRRTITRLLNAGPSIDAGERGVAPAPVLPQACPTTKPRPSAGEPRTAAIGPGASGRLLISARQAGRLEAAESALDRALHGLQTRGAALLELAADDVRAALAAIGEITGRNATGAVLARIFERFCIGK